VGTRGCMYASGRYFCVRRHWRCSKRVELTQCLAEQLPHTISRFPPRRHAVSARTIRRRWRGRGGSARATATAKRARTAESRCRRTPDFSRRRRPTRVQAAKAMEHSSSQSARRHTTKLACHRLIMPACQLLCLLPGCHVTRDL
jgi:hypothetical protein